MKIVNGTKEKACPAHQAAFGVLQSCWTPQLCFVPLAFFMLLKTEQHSNSMQHGCSMWLCHILGVHMVSAVAVHMAGGVQYIHVHEHMHHCPNSKSSSPIV